ncbi:hypothetical protein Tco_0716774 [Tanacetum coccineum]
MLGRSELPHLATNFEMNRCDMEAISSSTLPVGRPIRIVMGQFEYVPFLIGQKGRHIDMMLMNEDRHIHDPVDIKSISGQ